MLLTSAAVCLAANIYFEARNQPVEGQFAVAYVTINRAKANNTSICSEVLKPAQFSWTAKLTQKVAKSKYSVPKVGGVAKVSHSEIIKSAYPSQPKDASAFKRAFSIANLLLNPLNNFKDITKGSTYFHVVGLSPKWSKDPNIVKVVTIGDHSFYMDINRQFTYL